MANNEIDDNNWKSSETAERRNRGRAQRSAMHGQATQMMLDLAGVGTGSRVLDVAAGTGDQTLLAAQRVGPTGHVLATDISAAMMKLAADAARDAGHGRREHGSRSRLLRCGYMPTRAVSVC